MSTTSNKHLVKGTGINTMIIDTTGKISHQISNIMETLATTSIYMTTDDIRLSCITKTGLAKSSSNV